MKILISFCIALSILSCVKQQPLTSGQKTITKNILTGSLGRPWKNEYLSIAYYTKHINDQGMDSLVMDSLRYADFSDQIFAFKPDSSFFISDSLALILQLPPAGKFEIYQTNFRTIYLENKVLMITNYYPPSNYLEETLWLSLETGLNKKRIFHMRFVPVH